MREIKFRAWHKANKKFEYFTLKELLELSNSGDYQGYDSCYEHYEWCEYTGLKDKSGKEIYEGDVVRTLEVETGDPAFVLKLSGMEITTAVEWQGGAFMLRDKLGNTIGGGNYTLLAELVGIERNPYLAIEIIGNIYENPELLNK